MLDTIRNLVGADSGSRHHHAQDAPVLVPPRGTLLVRVHSVTLEPRNANKMVDFAGTIAQLGEGVTRFQVGDRVLVWSDATNKSKEGDIDEFAMAEQDNSCRVPDAMDFAEACSVGTRLTTVVRQLPIEHGGGDNNTMVLVSGGATPIGILATQLIKMAGYTPIVTCSPTDNALCQEYGAAACFDNQSPACGADIRVHTDNSLRYALDCVADDVSMKMCYEALGSGSGLSHYFGLEKPANAIAVKYTRRDVQAHWTLADDVQVLDGGLDNLTGALEDLKTGRVYHSKKLVVPLVA